MGIVGMWVPKPCPAPNAAGYWRVKCCEHNPCPDRPHATAKYQTNPWRCPQCKSWWITEKEWPDSYNYKWHKVCEQVGDTFIMDLK